ncbi:hypothetical protein [Actinoplanes sp. ATCC 53533]|uniref:hypothetical protein n=1 Tax=Actinoplanes sp. ATCC 53533 TaxID=1288362 RepID=UPI000F774FC6|nr:hypothetical protein [Actinoplanes sp. ATCC 53533]
MTSFDGGGFAGDDPHPDGPGRRAAAAGGPGPHDDDPVRLAPPADPWLTEASTSALGDAASVPGPDEPPPADTTPFAGPAPAGDEAPHAGPFAGMAPHAGSDAGWAGGTPPRRRGRRATRWVVAVLAACALFVAGMLAIDQFGPDDGSDAQGPGPATEVTAPLPTRTGNGQKQTPTATGGPSESPAGAAGPATSANPGSPEVVYQVTASGSRNVGSVTYTDQDGDIIRLSGIPFPWRMTFPRGERKPLILNAQRKRGGDAGPVTCTITLDGKLLSSTTAEGRYASAQCSGSGR